MTHYFRLEDVLRQVERAGFVVGDAGLLESALARPRASAFGKDAYATLWEKAAALCQSIDNNQSLVDGNKRMAWLATKVFLRINGQRLAATADDGERFMLELVASRADIPTLAAWLEGQSTASRTTSGSDDEAG